MNPRPNERPDADALDAFWDELVLGRNARQTGTPEEEMVLTLQNTLALDDPSAESRLHGLIFGSTSHAVAAAPVQALPEPKQEPIRPSWSIRKYTRLAAAAMAVILVGALVAAQNAGFFGSRGNDDTPTAIPAAIAQLDATPAALASPTVDTNAILWTLPFDGANVEVGATTLSGGTLYRLIRSDDFTGVQAVDTTTGTEKWRSVQEWTGNSIAAGADGVAFLTDAGVTALDPASGDAAWSTELPDMAPVSLVQREAAFWVWDGISKMVTLNGTDGRIGSPADAGLTVAPDTAPARQAPVATENGVAAVSAAGTVVLFGATVNGTGTAGSFDPETVELAATSSGSIAVAGAQRLETDQPWLHSLMLVDPAKGSTTWQTNYYASNSAMTVVNSIAFILGAVTGDNLVGRDAAEQQSQRSQVWGVDLADGSLHYYIELDPTQLNSSGHAWVSDRGTSPFVGLAYGTKGPIAVSESGQLSFFRTENPMVQAVVTLPGVLANQIVSNDAAVFTSDEHGTLTAVAPDLANLEPQPVSPTDTIDWSMPLDGQLIDFGGMTYGEGLVYRLVDAGTGPQIEATFAATGQPAWTLPFDWSTDQLVADPGPDQHDPAQTWIGSGNIFAVDSENRLIAIDGATGALAWQHAFVDPVISMLHDAGALYVWDESGTMTAILPQDGSVLWSTSAGSASGPQSNELGMPVPAATTTTIAMVDAEGTLHAFNKGTGDVLWSTPGFDGINTRLVHQGNAAFDQQEWFVVLSANGPQQDDGAFAMTLSGLLTQTGERRWDDYVTGPLVQPVATNETMVFVVGNGAETGKAVAQSTPIVDGESHNHYVWTGSGEPAPAGGGQRIFAFDVNTGQIVWIRTTAAGGFANLSTTFPNSGALTAATTDGLLVSPSRGNGSIDGPPTELGGPVVAILASGESGAIGSFATLSDGTLVAFGGTPFSQQG